MCYSQIHNHISSRLTFPLILLALISNFLQLDEVATRKEAERQLEAADLEYQRYRQEKKRAQQQAAALAEQQTQPNKKQ